MPDIGSFFTNLTLLSISPIMENYLKPFEQYVNKNVTAEIVFQAIIITQVAEFLWEQFLKYRQYRVYQKHTEMPLDLMGVVTKETFEKARLYAISKSHYGIVHDWFDFGLSLCLLFKNGFAYFWSIAGEIIAYLGYKDNEIFQGGAYVIVFSLFIFVTSLPFSVYFTFVIEEKYGFNKQTVFFFIKDKIKSLIVMMVISSPIGMAVTWIVQIGGKYFFVYLWVFGMLISLAMMTIYMDLIAPLFDKYTPLPEGELRTKIENLASSIDFPLKKLYVVEGSKRSSHSNAYFYGFFNNKRIVLFDTLLKGKDGSDPSKGCNDSEVIAVLGHELGHWKLNHVTKNIILAQINMLLVFLVFGALFKFKPLYAALGFVDSAPILIGLLTLIQYILAPYFFVLGWIMAQISRNFEFAADRFAKKLGRGHALRSALFKLNSDNLGFPINDPLYSSFYHSHPPLLERLEALDKTD